MKCVCRQNKVLFLLYWQKQNKKHDIFKQDTNKFLVIDNLEQNNVPRYGCGNMSIKVTNSGSTEIWHIWYNKKIYFCTLDPDKDKGPRRVMRRGLTLILVGHINFILGAIVHGNVLRHISNPAQQITTEYTVANIISVTSGLLVSHPLWCSSFTFPFMLNLQCQSTGLWNTNKAIFVHLSERQSPIIMSSTHLIAFCALQRPLPIQVNESV